MGNETRTQKDGHRKRSWSDRRKEGANTKGGTLLVLLEGEGFPSGKNGRSGERSVEAR